MVTHMKTTIEISDPLTRDARRLAASRKLTLRALVEEGLRLAIARHQEEQPFRLRHVTFGGDGLRPEFADAGWERIRDAAYEGQGA